MTFNHWANPLALEYLFCKTVIFTPICNNPKLFVLFYREVLIDNSVCWRPICWLLRSNHRKQWVLFSTTYRLRKHYTICIVLKVWVAVDNVLNLYFSYRDFTQGTPNPFLFSVHFFWHVESIYIPISRNLVLYWNLHKQSTSRKKTWEQFYFYPHPHHSAGALFVDVKFGKNENNSNTLYLEEHPALWVLKTRKATGETCYFGITAGAAALGRSCL